MTTTCQACNRPLKATVAQAVRFGALRGGWGTYKHALIRAGVIPSSDADVPPEWQFVFKKANGRA
jgi:hypothetical protein